jgi:beta-glucosidase
MSSDSSEKTSVLSNLKKPDSIRSNYGGSEQPIADRVKDLLSQMSLEEKIGQMTLVDKNSITPEEITDHFIGAVLSGGGGYPAENTPAGWLEMVNRFQEAALKTRLKIPLLYGVDAVHGHNNLHGAVIFPHNIGLGATRDKDLIYRIGRATAIELRATGVRWNYAPTVAVPQDLRWGRTFEGFSEDPSLVSDLAKAYMQGLQGEELNNPFSVLATPKHFLGDGGTTWGSSKTVFPAMPVIGIHSRSEFMIDQGDTRLDEATLRRIHLKPYLSLIEGGAQVIMPSFSSWNGEKLHSHYYLLTEVLERELGFPGFIVTDWAGIDQVHPDYYQALVKAINAGIDMSMVPLDFKRFISNMKCAVENNDISEERINDAVKRILSVKVKAGLFERPLADQQFVDLVGSEDHRNLAREAMAKSMVLLKNESQTIPLSRSTPKMLMAGKWADDIGLQCGGWTIEWLGKPGDITPGTTILEAVRRTVSEETAVDYDPGGNFSQIDGKYGEEMMADTGLVVVGEQPYAEGFGDQADLTLTEEHIHLIERMRQRCKRLVLILVSGRPLILTDQLPRIDALVAAWLPGTEGQGVADALFGDVPFTGRLPYTWPLNMEQIELKAVKPNAELGQPLFPFGFGLT